MSDLFNGLEMFGFSDLNNLTLYDAEKQVKDTLSAMKKEITAADCLYDKSYVCPVCDVKFTARTVKKGKARLVSTDTDFRPIYTIINPLLYDVIVCNSCGYAALNNFFPKLRPLQIKWIKTEISSKFKPKQYPEVYTPDIAIERYKLALLNAVVKKAKPSEKAYLCLKIGWFYRDKEDTENEKRFLEQALIGFKDAFSKESFPICGMNEHTLTYLIGELSRKLGHMEEALRWLSQVIIARNVNPRLKDRARDLKDLINKDRKKIKSSL